MSKLLSSPFNFKGEGYLGKIYRPDVQILICSVRVKEWVPIDMIVDTGADYTLLPKRYARLFEVNLEKNCTPNQTYGVGGHF